jgi:RimJ/RimL family protein N-acetyltransferase
MNPSWHLRTGRLILRPVSWGDLAELEALKGDPRAYAVMLGGVRNPGQVAAELAGEVSDWSRLGFGMWAVRAVSDGRFVGLVGLQERPDGRGVGLRFALRPEEQGHGFASEAAGAALRFAHERAGLARVVAVAREDNIGSRQVLGGIGMAPRSMFLRDGIELIVYESRDRSR